MQELSASRRRDRPNLIPLIGGTLVGAVLLIGGLALAFFAFATPVLQRLMPGFGASGGQVAFAMVMITTLLVVPGVCILVGTARLARMFASVRHHVRWRSPVASALSNLPEGVTTASGLTLPDGRTVSDLVVGPFGAAVIRELPPASLTRIREGRWELRTDRGWIALENPLDRATRDADRVRRWLGGGDADFVVKVYAAVVGPAASITRTPGCAVVSTDELAVWINGLPAQRSLTAGRQQRILDTVESALG